jgi:hypothetical protein
MEFESKSLRVEKVLSGNGEAVINLRPQKPGRYEFFDDFHAATTKGVVIVSEALSDRSADHCFP